VKPCAPNFEGTSLTSPTNLSAHGYDLATIKPLGGYPATQCPVRTRFAVLPPDGVEPAPVDEVTQSRFDAGNEFEALVFGKLRTLHPDAVEIADGPKPAMIAATVAAMDARVPLILGGRLPDDELGRRTGKPDILLFDVDGYLPVDVKVYTLFDDDEERAPKVLTSTLAEPGFTAASPTAGVTNGHRRNAALQLAHYWRMLEVCGQASGRGAYGAIIDSGERLVWIDLNAPDARIQNKATFEDEKVTWLRSYDHEFEFRRDVAAHTKQIENGADLAPKVTPVAIGECTTCEWNVYCRPELEERDHISLLPNMSYWAHRELRLRDVTTRRQVAELDHFTASVARELSRPQLTAALDPANADTPLVELWKRAPKAVSYAESLATEGIVSAGDLAGRLTDDVVLDLGGKLSPDWIDQARASLLGSPLLARGFTSLDLPVYDIEVDFDMENDLAGNVYLWGLLVSHPSVVEPVETTTDPYEVIDAYEPDVDGSGALLEAAIFLRFWNRVHDLRDQGAASGQTFQMYYWSHAELTVAKRICDDPAVDGLPSVDEVEAFFAESCTDLEAVLKAHFVMPSGTSVKNVAPLAGHDWSAVHDLADEDSDGEGASGDVSMIKHRLAVEAPDDETRESAKLWLRTYNEQDVIATLRVRAWMRDSVATLPRADAELTGTVQVN